MKIAYAQMKVTAEHLDINTEKILRLIGEARAHGADLVVFPNFAVSGKMLGDTWNKNSFLRDCERCTEEIVAASKDIVVGFVNISVDWREKRGEKYFKYPALFFAQDGKIFAKVSGSGEFEIWLGKKKYWLGYNCDKTPSFRDSDFCINFFAEPFSLSRRDDFAAVKCPLIQVGCVGVQNTGKTIYTFDGGSEVINSRGEVVQRAEPFAECMNFVELEAIDKMPALAPVDEPEVVKIHRALKYGVKTFPEQIGLQKVVIGVSGGIDSAVAAALYVDVLGAENVYLVNMPSVFNSATTKSLSERLAKNLGCKYFVVPIQESVDWTVKQLEGVGVSVSNFVRENIQARDRSSRILAAIAAAVGGGFTCNANKAESTVGYATLYGDEAGFMSALADLWKFQVYELANYFNDEIFRSEVIPQGIIDIVPSAELSTAQNVDEGKGDPLKYPYHDYLLRAFVEQDAMPEDVLYWYATGTLEAELGCRRGLVKKYFPTAREFIADLERWWRQFTGMGVAKRIQSPPILAVTDRPFGSFNESQNGVCFTRGYLELKARLLG